MASGATSGSGPAARTASSTGLLAYAATVTGGNGPPGEPGGDQVARVTGPMRRVNCPAHRLGSAGSAPGSRRRANSPQPGKRPIRTHVRRPTRPPLLYFPAVLAVRFVRIRLLSSGAKRARTADLLHAIWRQHVHPCLSVQVTVLPRPRKSARVRVSCCTSVLYRCHPRRGTSRSRR
jgi:hypothetical protein